MKANDCLTFLRAHSVFWSKLGFCYDPLRLDAQGEPIVFFEDFDRFAKMHRDFAAAGVHVHTSILFNGWIGVDQYDYALTDRVLDAVFKNNPDIFYIPRIKLNVPLDWGKAHPEDMLVYYQGPRDAETIRSLVGTAKHDILGYHSPKGYYTAGGWRDDRPNVDGVISNQSFSSKQWLRDAGEALRRLIERLENGPYGERILAYHLGYGSSAETCLWGRCSPNLGDYGVNNRRAFYEWGLRKHGSLSELRKAWERPDLTSDNVEPPPPELREPVNPNLTELFSSGTGGRMCADYDRFMSDANVAAIEHFGEIVKGNTGGKAVGTFYGYFLECDNAAYTGWLGYDRIIASPHVDFIAAPKSYYRSGPGDPGGTLGAAQSINLDKLWFDELDNRTHLCQTQERQCENFAETRTVMWREFAKNLAHNSGFWWMDLGGGWYDSPEILKEVGAIERVARRIRSKPAESVSEVLLVVDEQACYQLRRSPSLHNALMKELVREFHLCGAPIDMYRPSDLERLPMSRYKLICFMNAFLMSREDLKRFEKLVNPERRVIWNYAAGILGNDFSLDNVKDLTGFALRSRPANPTAEWIAEANGPFHESGAPVGCVAGTDFPLLEVTMEDEVVPWATYTDGGVAVAARKTPLGGMDVMTALPALKMKELRTIVELAGVHCHAPANCAVYADSRFTAVFPKTNVEGEIHLKRAARVVDRISGKTAEGDHLDFKLEENRCVWLEIE